MFPIVDVQERVVAFGGRILQPADNVPKYLNSPETPVFSKSKTLYALNRARKSISELDQAVIVEGYMDVVACHQAGFTHVIATLGTALTDEHIRLLGRYTKNVVLSFDADDAGIRAALRSAELFASVGSDVFSLKVLNLPGGEDPDSLVMAGNKGAFQRAIDNALSVPEFHLLAIERQHNLEHPVGREQFLNQALVMIAEVRSPREQDKLIQKIAHYHPSWAKGNFNVEVSLQAELKRIQYGGRVTPEAASPSYSRPDYAPRPPNSGFSNGYTPRPDGTGRGTFSQGYTPSTNFGRTSGRRWNAPIEMPPVIARDATADSKAERTVLLALFSEEWTEVVRRRVRPSLFSDVRAASLVERTLPFLTAGQMPYEAINRAVGADPELMPFADYLLFTDKEEPLSLQAIDDCLLFLLDRKGKQQARILSQQVEENSFAEKQNKEIGLQEGKNEGAEEELLRQWQKTMETLKRNRSGDASKDIP